MTRMNSMRHASGILGSFALAALLAACDVTNPGPIQDEFVGDEAAQVGLIFGVQRQISSRYTDDAFDFALIGREIFPGGQIGAWGNPVQIHAGSVQPNYDNGSFDNYHTARFIAETAVARFTEAGASDERLHLARSDIHHEDVVLRGAFIGREIIDDVATVG